MTDTLADRYKESLDYHARAAAIPGRSLTRSKAPGRFFSVGKGPLFATRGRGAVIVDVDGHEYIDMLCGLGAISLGYGYDSGRAATEVGDGWVYSLPSFMETIAAESVLTHVAPWASSVRFVKTGSESTTAAYMVARSIRRLKSETAVRVFVGDWAYHGWHPWTETATRYGHGDDLFARVAQLERDRTFDPVPFAVFVEPHRWQPVDPAWLKHVRTFCDETGALLVFDEMIYGGRWALGGASELYGVTPDLACFGKALGNGAPIAFVAGGSALADYGEQVSGTYSGDAAALAALISTIKTYATTPVIETLWQRGTRLQRGLVEASLAYNDAKAGGDMASCEGAPVHQRLRFADAESGRRFSALMAERGVLWHPDCCNVSFSHSDADIDHVVESARSSLSEMAR